MEQTARTRIRDRALALGFDAVGFARADVSPAARADLRRFVAEGLHGDMGWLADTLDRRGDPRVLWPDARSVVVLALNYGPADDPRGLRPQTDRGAISVYAQNRDYHDVLKKRLKALATVAQSLTGDVSPLVRAMAAWALSRLMTAGAFAALAVRQLENESDPAVRAEWAGGA